MTELGIPDVQTLPGIAAAPARWAELHARMQQRIFLRSEGNLIDVGAPQVVTGALLARSTEVVAAANRFFSGVAATYYQRPELRDELLVNPMLEPLLELEADVPAATPLSRLDAVLEQGSGIRVIEINSVGVCLIHMRGLFYLIRELSRGGFPDEASRLDRLSRTMADGFLQFARARAPELPKRPVIGGLVPSGWFRAGQLLFRAAFERAGCEYVFGGPEHLELTERDVLLRGRRVDVLWPDFFFYIGYQYSRYKDIAFPAPMPGYGSTPALAAELASDPRFLAHLRRGHVVMVSPARSYLALSKSLLSWVHREDRPVDPEVRAVLARHVARTYSARDRADGLVTREIVERERGEYLIKPCQYGASFGVQLGRMLEPDAWRARLAEIWNDPSWAVQVFHPPIKTARGDWLSLGLQNFDGTLGGVFLRTSRSLLINARDAGFIPALPGGT